MVRGRPVLPVRGSCTSCPSRVFRQSLSVTGAFAMLQGGNKLSVACDGGEAHPEPASLYAWAQRGKRARC